MKIAYFVHDLQDPAARRRLRMLRLGGADVTLLGFSRSAEPESEIEGCIPVHLGRTWDARLGQRMLAVAFASLTFARLRKSIAGAQIVMARQLEMLVLAAQCRRRFAPEATLIYECLDIHRLMISPGLPGIFLRAAERHLLRKCQLLMVSSPAFVTEYFARMHAGLPPVRLEENKVVLSELGGPSDVMALRSRLRPPGPPWRIGWFGIIRCGRSLAALAALTRLYPGLIEVIIRGRPARNVVPEFDKLVSDTPGLRFLGSYDRSRDLADIYGEVHFIWTLDFYEAGGNSVWLLPNRLYEGCLLGAVPLAEASVQTGRWLKGHGIDLLLDGPIEISLPRLFETLDQERYQEAKERIHQIPLVALLDDHNSCASLVQALAAKPSADGKRLPD